MIEKSSSSLERTVLVGIITLEQPKTILEEYLNELNFLTYTAGGTVVNVGLLSWNSNIDIRKITLQEIKLIGCYTYNMEDFKSALKSIDKGDFGDLSWIEEMPLSETNLAFQSLHNGTMASAKVILKPSC